MEDDVIVEDDGNYKANSKAVGFKEIVMIQLQRVVVNGSQEMRKGFIIRSQMSPNQESQITRYIGDSRKEWIQSVNTLHDLLMPKFDEEMKKQSEELSKKAEVFYLMKDEEKNWRDYLKVTRTMFQQLCLFLNRKGWLASREINE